jgi:hypothetical protein
MNSGLARLHTIIFFFYVSIFALLVLVSLGGEGSAMLVGVILLPIAFLHWCAARGARHGERWGRTTSRVIAVLMIFGFPIGTLIAIYIFSQTGQKWQAAELQSLGAETAAD